MIGHLDGVLAARHPPQLVLDVGGVGYELEAPMSTFYRLPATGERVRLHTHLVVREDAQLLFGFSTLTERRLFRALLKVNGVGARVALSILSGMSVDEFASCVAMNDVASLVKIPGIGRKTAERLLVELKDRMGTPAVSSAYALDTPAEDEPDHREQAREALVALGYRSAEAKRLLDKVVTADQSVEDMIRAALRSVRP